MLILNHPWITKKIQGLFSNPEKRLLYDILTYCNPPMEIQRLELYNLPILTLSPLNVQETLPRHRTSSLAPRRRARRLGSPRRRPNRRANRRGTGGVDLRGPRGGGRHPNHPNRLKAMVTWGTPILGNP